MKFDWSVVGKAEHHSVVIFFSALQTVHMVQVNKPGVDMSAAAFKAEKSFLCNSFTKQLVVMKSV